MAPNLAPFGHLVAIGLRHFAWFGADGFDELMPQLHLSCDDPRLPLLFWGTFKYVMCNYPSIHREKHFNRNNQRPYNK